MNTNLIIRRNTVHFDVF